MNRNTIARLLVGATAFAAALPLVADTEIVDGIVWNYVVRDGRASICKGSGVAEIPPPMTGGVATIPIPTTGAIAIPDTLGGCPVTCVGDWAFYACTNLVSVTIPDGVLNIGHHAFMSCSALSNVTIPDSVMDIGEEAFSGCSDYLYDTSTIVGVKLVDGWAIGYENSISSDLNLHGARGIGSSAFYGCVDIFRVVLPESVGSIGTYAFCDCTNIVEVSFGEGLKIIQDGAFANCIGLRAISLPSSVVELGSRIARDTSVVCSQFLACLDGFAEQGTNYINEISFICKQSSTGSAESVDNESHATNKTSFATFSFFGADNLCSITGNCEWVRCEQCAFNSNALEAAFSCSTNLLCSGKVRYEGVGRGVFEGCACLESVSLNNGLRQIGAGAFRKCVGLKSLAVPDTVVSIGGHGETVLRTCSFSRNQASATAAAVGETPTCCSSSSFCSNEVSETFFVGSGFVQDCINLEWIHLPTDLEYLGPYSFAGCANLKSLQLPCSILTLGECAFLRSVSLRDIEYQGGLSLFGISELMPSNSYEYAFGSASSTSGTGTDAIINNGGVTSTRVSSMRSWFYEPDARCIVVASCSGGAGLAGDGGVVSTTVSSNVLTLADVIDDMHFADRQVVELIGDDVTEFRRFLAWAKYVGIESATQSSCAAESYLRGATELDLDNINSNDNFAGAFDLGNGADGDAYDLNVAATVEPNDPLTAMDANFMHTKWFKWTAPDGVSRAIFHTYGSDFDTVMGVYTGGPTIDMLVPVDPLHVVDRGEGDNLYCKFNMSVTPGEVYFICVGGYDACGTIHLCWRASDEFGLVVADDGTLCGFLGDCPAEVEIPDTVKRIETEVFSAKLYPRTASIKGVIIPDSVTNIGDYAFYNCSGLKSIVFKGDAPTVGSSAFSSVASGCTVRVPKGSTGWGVDIPGTWNGLRIEYCVFQPLSYAAGAEDVAIALAEAADAGLAAGIADGTNYNAFCEWAERVKGSDGATAGAQAVKESGTAWLSYALGADRLVADALTGEDVKIESFEVADRGEGTAATQFSFEVSLKDVGIGDGVFISDVNRELVKANLRKVLGVEGAATLDQAAFSSDDIDVVFDVPQDGKARFTVTPPSDAGNAYFMRVKLK